MGHILTVHLTTYGGKLKIFSWVTQQIPPPLHNVQPIINELSLGMDRKLDIEPKATMSAVSMWVQCQVGTLVASSRDVTSLPGR